MSENLSSESDLNGGKYLFATTIKTDSDANFTTPSAGSLSSLMHYDTQNM